MPCSFTKEHISVSQTTLVADNACDCSVQCINNNTCGDGFSGKMARANALSPIPCGPVIRSSIRRVLLSMPMIRITEHCSLWFSMGIVGRYGRFIFQDKGFDDGYTWLPGLRCEKALRVNSIGFFFLFFSSLSFFYFLFYFGR